MHPDLEYVYNGSWGLLYPVFFPLLELSIFCILYFTRTSFC
jgi:hypothetical protein